MILHATPYDTMRQACDIGYDKPGKLDFWKTNDRSKHIPLFTQRLLTMQALYITKYDLKYSPNRCRTFQIVQIRQDATWYDTCDRILQDRTNAIRSVIFENIWNHILRYQVSTMSAITVSTTGVFRTIISASEVEFLELVVTNVARLSHDVVWCRMQNRREMVHFSRKWRGISKIGDVGLPEW